ncbi:MAG: acyl-CoA dehydrogenase family protein [Actinomycetes bacterium]
MTPEVEAFRAEVRAWLAANLKGDYAELGGAGGPGREHEGFDVRQRWEKLLGASGWIGLGWPKEHGGRGATLMEQVVFAEEYARAGAPARVGHIGENLVAPTLIDFGTPDQQQRLLPGILAGDELWCQGYSEPNAGSDLANVQTRAVLDGDYWVITGQKVWTSLAVQADWCFVLARTEPDSQRHHGLSYLLVPMQQPGVEVRPIVQITGTSEFNEVFFDGARTATANVVGDPGEGWRVAMGTLGYERGVSTLAQQIGFERDLHAVAEAARSRGLADDPIVRDRLADAWIGLHVMRQHALRTLAGNDPGAASVSKLVWANWHQRLGELAIDVLGASGTLADAFPYELSDLQRLALFTRSDTIYGGSNEIQRNIIAERVLGLPREHR